MDAKLLIDFVFENCGDGLKTRDSRLLLSHKNRHRWPEIWQLVQTHQAEIAEELRRQVLEACRI